MSKLLAGLIYKVINLKVFEWHLLSVSHITEFHMLRDNFFPETISRFHVLLGGRQFNFSLWNIARTRVTRNPIRGSWDYEERFQTMRGFWDPDKERWEITTELSETIRRRPLHIFLYSLIIQCQAERQWVLFFSFGWGRTRYFGLQMGRRRALAKINIYIFMQQCQQHGCVKVLNISNDRSVVFRFCFRSIHHVGLFF